MIGKTGNVGQKDMFLPNLVELVNPERELSLLGGKLDWDGIESGFASLYSDVGCRAKPIRLMVGLLILKQMYDLARWSSRELTPLMFHVAIFMVRSAPKMCVHNPRNTVTPADEPWRRCTLDRRRHSTGKHRMPQSTGTRTWRWQYSTVPFARARRS